MADTIGAVESVAGASVAGKKILFVTAFKELGRERWAHYARRTDEYFDYFANLVQTLPHPLTVFIEDGLRARAQAVIDAAAAADRVTVRDHGAVDSFLTKYLERERAVMAAPEFRQLVAHRRDCPETHNPEYTLVNHSKINFVRAAQTAQPDFDFYAWVDFGMCRGASSAVPRLDVGGLPDKITYNTIAVPETRLDELRLLDSGAVFLTGDSFIVPAARVAPFEAAWEAKLLSWQARGLADDDQALVLQLFYDDPGQFALTVGGRWFMLYQMLPRL